MATNPLDSWSALTPQQQKQLGISIGSMALVLACYLFLLLLPMVQRLQRVVLELARLGRELKRVEISVGHQGQVEQQAAALQERLRQLQSQFLLEGEVSTTALEKLSNFAKTSGVKIDVMQPMKPEAVPDEAGRRHYVEVPIWVDAKGSYHQLGTFLDKVEHDTQLMQLRRLDLTGNPAEMRRHNIRLVLLAAVLREPASATEGAAPH